MPDELGKVFNAVANAPDPPGKDGPDAPSITPSEQVANHALGLHKGPPPPSPFGETVAKNQHLAAMERDQNRSDRANNYTRPQSAASREHLDSLRKLFQQQDKKQAPAKQKTIDRNREREHGDD